MFRLRAWARHTCIDSAKASVTTLGTKLSNSDISFRLLNAHELTRQKAAEELHCTANWYSLGLQAKTTSTVSGQISSPKLICPCQIITDSKKIW